MNNSAQEKKIHRHMTIQDILDAFPHRAQAMAQAITEAGLHCVGCQAATWETLEAGMKGHGMSDAQVLSLEERLNKIVDQTQDLTTITLTKSAADKYRAILAEEGKEGFGLRFTERLAGCSGFEYALDYSEKAQDDDEIFLSHGIEMHVEKKLVPRLIGSEIDYIDSLHASGFKISNPNVSSSCGCGSSHGY